MAPSGLASPPRPFVFRFGDEEIGLNLFTRREPPIELFAGVMGELGLELANAPSLLSLPLAPRAAHISRLRVRFLTATELGKTRAIAPSRRGGDESEQENPRPDATGLRPPRARGTHVPEETKMLLVPDGFSDEIPEFGVLARRIRDRISTLRSLYGAGPLDIDFRAFGKMADSIRLAHCELTRVDAERVSKRTGQRHSLGGFTGFAEYEGALAAFLPYLEAARYTGVGRQTVWGKGEIAVEEI